ncbi:MAG: ribose 5-phosphate isomerase B [Synergistaceae bacterium]|nr:ribose 5-phosphate isomerase B [Synergistaceae bacterium]
MKKNKIRIAFGSDHVGYELKLALMAHASDKGYECTDFGCHSVNRVDYPVYGYRTAKAVQNGVCDLGVLVCGTGVGISLVANKINGIRAVVCSEPYTAKLSREHNNTNMLALGARVVGTGLAKMMLDTWLGAEFEDRSRHEDRVNMINEIEKTGGLRQD